MSSSVRDTSVTREEVRRRTSELVPVLKERAARTEQLRQIPLETVRDLVSSGLIRIGNPQRYGGLGIEMDPSRAGDGEWTGWELHRRLSYRLPFRCMTGWDLLTPLIGIAQGAVDEFTSRLRGTSGPGRTADSMLVQVRLAEASVEVDAARELLRHSIREILEKAERGEEFTSG